MRRLEKLAHALQNLHVCVCARVCVCVCARARALRHPARRRARAGTPHAWSPGGRGRKSGWFGYAIGLKLQLGWSGGFVWDEAPLFALNHRFKSGNLIMAAVPVNLCPSPSIGPAHRRGTLNFSMLHGLNRPVSKGNRFASYARVYANYGPIILNGQTIQY